MTPKIYLVWKHLSCLNFLSNGDETYSGKNHGVQRDIPMEVLIGFQISLGDGGLNEGLLIYF